MDLADAHIKALDYSAHNMTPLDQLEIFNLGNGNGYSVFEVLEAYSKCSNIKIPYEIYKRRDADIAISLADASKANKLLNWSPQYNLEQMCSSSWNFTLKSANE
jgi:UDP-glucose 4-epimerase